MEEDGDAIHSNEHAQTHTYAHTRPLADLALNGGVFCLLCVWCVCVCVYVCVCMHVMYVCMYVCMCVYVYFCM